MTLPARATSLFTRELDEEGRETGRTLMLPVKNNLSDKRNNGISYRIAGFDFGGGVTAPYVVWDEAVSITADQALAMTLEPPTGGGDDGDALGVAMAFLEDEITAAGRVEASVVLASARRAGISEATLKRARKKLGAVSKREGFGEDSKFFLSLPH
jgi:hypothetical protein